MPINHTTTQQNSAHQLFEKYYRLVPYLVYRITHNSNLVTSADQEDIISKTYLVLWEICLKQRKEQEASFKSYLYIRIKGAIIDEIRKKKRIYDQAIKYAELFNSLITEDASINQAESQMESKDKAELQRIISEAFSGLNKKEKIVISEFYLKEKKFCQIARENEGLSKSWVSKVHRQALKKMRGRISTEKF